MNTQAYFDNIQKYILEELKKSHHSVIVSVAWFTDSELFQSLCLKARQGIQVELMLMNDEINNDSSLNYDLLVNAGGKIWKISADGNLMHNKFCVIDKKTIINGSYNWTNKARQNHESITIIEDAELAIQFIQEFDKLKTKYFGEQPEALIVDYCKLCIRLETLKYAITLQDNEDIEFQTHKLKRIVIPQADDYFTIIQEIIANVEKEHYDNAINLITGFVAKFQTLTVYIDSEIEAIKLEIKSLGLQISSLEDEKNEIEKLLYTFNIRHNNELGEIIEKILWIKKEKLKEEAHSDESKKNKAEEAESDYNKYHKSYQETKDKNIQKLDKGQQKELRNIYRNATKLCHPDVVNEEQQKEACEIFHKLKDAYDNNNLDLVIRIYEDLRTGIFTNKTENVSEKQKLKLILIQLRNNRDNLEQGLLVLKQSQVYQRIIEISDWDAYFLEKKRQLQEELLALTDK